MKDELRQRIQDILNELAAEEPWTLLRQLPGFRALRDGEEWHRQDFTKEMLEGGWRPLLLGEPREIGDKTGNVIVSHYPAHENKANAGWTHSLTKRPLPILTPEQIAEGWKEWHGDENPVPGKKVAYMMRGANSKGEVLLSNRLCWAHAEPRNYDVIAYRVIEPKLIPIGPEDVPPGSVFRDKTGRYVQFWSVGYVTQEGVNLGEKMISVKTYPALMRDDEINRSIPLTGKWDATAWEPCSKEAAE